LHKKSAILNFSAILNYYEFFIFFQLKVSNVDIELRTQMKKIQKMETEHYIKVEALQAQVAVLERSNQELENISNQTERLVNTKKSEIAAIQAELAKTKKESATVENQRKQLVEQLTSHTEMSDQCRESHREELNVINQQVHSLILEKSKFISTITDLDRKLKSASSENCKLQDKCAQLQEATQMRHDQEVQRLQKMLEDSEAKYKMMKTNTEKTARLLKSDYEALKSEYNRMDAQKKSLENTLLDLEVQVSVQKEKIVRLETLSENPEKDFAEELQDLQDSSNTDIPRTLEMKEMKENLVSDFFVVVYSFFICVSFYLHGLHKNLLNYGKFMILSAILFFFFAPIYSL
jgi:chromosome segregation ATPase